jgi:hypothetical protein
MTHPVPWLRILVLALAVAGCGREAASKSRAREDTGPVTPDQRDAAALGREIFDLVDRAVAYRGSHRGRPANSLRQMGLESLTVATVRRVENLQREPVITVAFRKTAGREIVSCRGTSQILEDITLNGRFTIMCTARSGTQRLMEVGSVLDP